MSEESKKWYKMTMPVFNSGFEDDEFWAYGRDGFLEVLNSFLGRDVLVYEGSTSVSPLQVRAIIQNATSDAQTTSTVRQILCNIGILKCGQYVRFEGAWWLVSGLPDNNNIYEKAVLWKCKYNLRFISPLTNSVVEYPIYDLNSTQYGTGELNKENISIGTSHHLIYIPYNRETILVDDRFRFLMDKNRVNPTAYRVTQVDPISYSVGGEQEDGLIQWTVTEAQFDPRRDNAELMVANYYKDEPESDSSSEGGSVLILTDEDGDMKLAIGESKRIFIRLVNADGEIVTDFGYDAAIDDVYGAVSMEEEAPGVIVLTADFEEDNVGRVITLEVTSPEYMCSASIEIQIVDW